MANESKDKTTKDPEVNEAVSKVAKQLGLTEMDALKVIVSAGAEKLAKDLGANAFAGGSDLRFQEQQAGKSLIGHELTHTLQQTTPLQQSVGEMERSAKQAKFFKQKLNASSDASN